MIWAEEVRAGIHLILLTEIWKSDEKMLHARHLKDSANVHLREAWKTIGTQSKLLLSDKNHLQVMICSKMTFRENRSINLWRNYKMPNVIHMNMFKNEYEKILRRIYFSLSDFLWNVCEKLILSFFFIYW